MMQLLVLILNLVSCDVHWKNMRIVLAQTPYATESLHKIYSENCLCIYTCEN